MRRGAFVVLEGLDRAGKSTQVSLLVEALKNHSIPVEQRTFPDRNTAIGKIINDYLTKKIELPPEAVHLLFSANRWECKDDICQKLEQGTTLIVDRYAASGAAYSKATTGKSLEWCKSSDRGLPAPDLVIYLDVSPAIQEERSQWGEERYERAEMQCSVRQNFMALSKLGGWNSYNADQNKAELHKGILDRVLDVLEECKEKPISFLYDT